LGQGSGAPGRLSVTSADRLGSLTRNG